MEGGDVHHSDLDELLVCELAFLDELLVQIKERSLESLERIQPFFFFFL